MLMIVFLVVLLVVVVILAVTGNLPATADLPFEQLLAIIAVFAVFFAAGIYVAAALGALALLADVAFSSGRGISDFLSQVAWRTSTNFLIVAVPLFLLMSEILLRAGLSDRLYRALNVWTGGLPGGLLHTNIVSSAVFSAVTGSSIANAATIGRVALPYFRGTRYPERMVLGSLAAGGALGNLIPPGISFIIYSVFTGASVGQMYAAGLVAGVLAALVFMGYIFLHTVATRRYYGEGPSASIGERIGTIIDMFPTLVLIGIVLGLLYLGFATATEVAALGVVGALVIAAMYRTLTFSMLRDSIRATARTTSMVGLILIAALSLNFVLGAIHLPAQLAAAIGGLPLTPFVTMLVIVSFYIALGTFMDGFAIMVMTLPVMFPVVTNLGYDPVWFGVVMTMTIEIALISPPDGLVMYVLQGLRSPTGPITDVFVGVMPFVGLYLFTLLVIIAWPDLVLWPITRVAP